MRKVIILIGLIFAVSLLLSCSDIDSKAENIRKERTIQSESFRMDNPALFLGTSFAHFLQSCHKIGDYKQMLLYTSVETRAVYGDSVLLEFYQYMQFSYPLKLKSVHWSGIRYTMYYSTNIEATEKTIQIIGVIENDSCKLVIQKLDFEKPFVGM